MRDEHDDGCATGVDDDGCTCRFVERRRLLERAEAAEIVGSTLWAALREMIDASVHEHDDAEAALDDRAKVPLLKAAMKRLRDARTGGEAALIGDTGKLTAARLAGLEALVRDFAGHKRMCFASLTFVPKRECGCGYDEARSALEEATR